VIRSILPLALVLAVVLGAPQCEAGQSPSGSEPPKSDDTAKQRPAPKTGAPQDTKAPPAKEEPKAWQKDFATFAREFVASWLAKEDLVERFTHREITWTVTFRSFNPKDSPPELQFEEAAPLKKLTPEMCVSAVLMDSEKAKAAALKGGDRIIIRGKMEYPHIFLKDGKPYFVSLIPWGCTVEKAPK